MTGTKLKSINGGWLTLNKETLRSSEKLQNTLSSESQNCGTVGTQGGDTGNGQEGWAFYLAAVG